MRTFFLAYIGGMIASIPIGVIFTNAGIGMLDGAGGLSMLNRMSLAEIIQFYGLMFLVPPIGSAIGAKIGGRGAEVHYMIGRGVSGQIMAYFVLLIIFLQFPGFEATLIALTPNGQTIAMLGLLQIGCTLGTVWGL